MSAEELCNYAGCKEPVREEDRTLGRASKKYCEEHGREIDDLLESGDAGKIMQWWVKSYRNPAQATEETK